MKFKVKLSDAMRAPTNLRGIPGGLPPLELEAKDEKEAAKTFFSTYQEKFPQINSLYVSVTSPEEWVSVWEVRTPGLGTLLRMYSMPF